MPILYCDNKSALSIAANPIFCEWTKHLETDCQMTREKLSLGHKKLLPLSSANQIADLFTKALAPMNIYQSFDLLDTITR
jgi:hypothetical protein